MILLWEFYWWDLLFGANRDDCFIKIKLCHVGQSVIILLVITGKLVLSLQPPLIFKMCSREQFRDVISHYATSFKHPSNGIFVGLDTAHEHNSTHSLMDIKGCLAAKHSAYLSCYVQHVLNIAGNINIVYKLCSTVSILSGGCHSKSLWWVVR